MTQPLATITMPGPDEFVERYVAPGRPVVVRGLDYDPGAWTAEGLRARAGDLDALVYGALFDLEDIQTLDDYLDDWFRPVGPDGPVGAAAPVSEVPPFEAPAFEAPAFDAPAFEAPAFEAPAFDADGDVPYVRWYNKLRDVEAAWGDEALNRMADTWRAPSCLPADGLVLPAGGSGPGPNPVTDPFPYRGLLVAAAGARTRLHRDPFGTDAVVAQFAGAKEAVLYHPDRTAELSLGDDSTSFGGFLDVRGQGLDRLLAEPDFQGVVRPGEMIYIPRGWLHDVLVIEDSLSVTWNFVHASGSRELQRYLLSAPEADSEFEILRYFHALAGRPELPAREMAAGLAALAR